MENRSIVRMLADSRLDRRLMVRTACPPASVGNARACADCDGRALRPRTVGGSQCCDVAGTSPALMPKHVQSRVSTDRRAIRFSRGYPNASTIGGARFDQFGSQHAGGNSSPCPLRRTSRQSSGTTPWAGVSPNPLPAHGETLGIGHYPGPRTLSFSGDAWQALLPHLHLRSARR